MAFAFTGEARDIALKAALEHAHKRGHAVYSDGALHFPHVVLEAFHGDGVIGLFDPENATPEIAKFLRDAKEVYYATPSFHDAPPYLARGTRVVTGASWAPDGGVFVRAIDLADHRPRLKRIPAARARRLQAPVLTIPRGDLTTYLLERTVWSSLLGITAGTLAAYVSQVFL